MSIDQQTSIFNFTKDILVECPKCHSKAISNFDRVVCTNCLFVEKISVSRDDVDYRCEICHGRVKRNAYPEGWRAEGLKCVSCRTLQLAARCDRCGAPMPQNIEFDYETRKQPKNCKCFTCGSVNVKIINQSRGVVNNAIDPYFGLPLWLQASCCAHVLWAYNHAHLDFIKQYVTQLIRPSGLYNRSLISRLPKWIKSSNNRNAVLRVIERLENSN